MLFRRKIPLNWWQKLRHLLWPRSGWTRAAIYVWHRLARLKDSPHGVAAGVASGVAISVTPFVGFHLIGAMGMALATRGNLVAAWIGTLVGNPWTFPVIWIIIHRLGTWMLGMDPSPDAERLSLEMLIRRPGEAFGPMLLPMAVGAMPLALASWFVTYWPVRRAIERFRARRQRKLEGRRVEREATADSGRAKAEGSTKEADVR